MDELSKARSLLSEVQTLSQEVPSLTKVCQKLARKIRADTLFLEKQSSRKPIDEDSNGFSSSNMPYLAGVLKVVKQSQDVKDVLCDLKRYGVTVDVVCDGGKTWKKVVARNPQSLHLIWAGRGQYGTKDIVKKVEKYLDAAQTLCEFSPPQAVCVFCNGITEQMASALEEKGIKVEGERVSVSQEVLDRLKTVEPTDSDDSDSDADLFEQARRKLESPNSAPMAVSYSEDCQRLSHTQRIQAMSTGDKVFLDITSMLVYVSDICNGGANFEFSEKVLCKQAAQERERSALDKIRPHVDSKTLVSCQSAIGDFENIVHLLGGPEEKKRAAELMPHLTIVPDCISARFESLSESGQIRPRSKLIFGTADMLKCPILTSNEGFIRATAGQDIHISAYIHEPRALSERKRLNAIVAKK